MIARVTAACEQTEARDYELHDLYTTRPCELPDPHPNISTMHHNDCYHWVGHCGTATLASILLNQPIPTAASQLTTDELEGLWAGFYVGVPEVADEDELYWDVPADKPRPRKHEPVDAYAGALHRSLERFIHDERVPLHAGLRSPESTEYPNADWNHAVYMYGGIFKEYDEEPLNNHRVIYVKAIIRANADTCLVDPRNSTPNTSGETYRTVEYEYVVEFNDLGKALRRSVHENFLAVGGEAVYAPEHLVKIIGVTAATPDNIYLHKAKIESMDENNPLGESP